MTAQLTPPTVQRFFDNQGNSLANGLVYTYQAGTAILQASYVDSTQTTQNTNPIQLNARGEASIWLNPTLAYKINVTDSNGNQLPGWPVDNIPGGYLPAIASLISPILSSITAYPLSASTVQTGAEIAASATPTNFAYAPGVVDRYKTNTIPGTTDMTTAVQAAINVWQHGAPAPQFITGNYAISASLSLPTNLYLDLQGATITALSGSFHMFALSAGQCGISNGQLVATATSGNAINYTGSGTAGFIFRRLVIQCGGNYGLQMANCYTSFVEDCIFTNGSSGAVYLYSTISGTATNTFWFRNCGMSNFTGNVPVLLIQDGTAIYIDSCNFQFNAATNGVSDIRITTDTLAGSSGVQIYNCYFETTTGYAGNNIYVGDPASGSNVCAGVNIHHNVIQGARQPIKIGADVVNDITIKDNTFIGIGGPTYAVSTPSGFIPNCHSNNGSQADINRSFIPTLLLGGGNTGMTGTFNGRYQRIDNVLRGEIQITLTAKGTSTGFAQVGGLPMPAYAFSLQNGAWASVWSGMAGLTGNIVGNTGANTSVINLNMGGGATSSTSLADTNFTNTSALYIQFSLECAQS